MGSIIDSDTIRRVADLARLRVSAEEVALYAEQLSNILEYMRQLNALDTSGVPPTAHAVALANVFRDDEIIAPWTQVMALANAPQHQDGYFKLPKVLDQDGA